MKITLSDGTKVKVKKIDNISKYRGFYAKLEDGTYVKASFDTYGMESGYNLGYETNGLSISQHLYNKLKNKEKLSHYEKIDFYDKINLKTATMPENGFYDKTDLTPEIMFKDDKIIDFKKFMHKIPGVKLFVLEKTISKLWLKKVESLLT